MKFGKKKEEFNYFDAFIENANYAKEIIEKLKAVINGFETADIEVKTKEIHEIENKADKNLHKLKGYLLKDFLPPIDREDILNIVHKVDDIIDDIDEIIIDINILNVTYIKENMRKMIDLLEETTNKTYSLIENFKNMKNIQAIQEEAIEVNNFEEQGDRMYEEAMRDLFKEEKDSIEVIKWSRIYETIEDCFDACENVADCIEEVLMKNC